MAPPNFSGAQRVLLNTLTAALVLRLLHLPDLSLWADEGVTWWNATQGSLRDAVFAEANHPPVWWLVTRGWLALFPGREAALRLPAVLLGVVSVGLTYLLARRLSDPERTPARGGFLGSDGRTALWVAIFAATNPFWIEYAQEARMYSALLAESLGLSLLYLRWLDGGRRGTLVAYGALATLALYTHYFAVWPIAAHAAHALWLARVSRHDAAPLRPLPLLVAQTAAGVAFVPWVVVLALGYRGISPGQFEPFGRLAHALWRMGTGPGLVALDRPRVEAGPAAVFAQQPVVAILSALAWLVPIVFGARTIARDRGGRAFVATSVLVPLGLVLLACVRWPLVHEKYLIFLAPFLLYLAVLGARSAPGLARPVLFGGLVALHVAGLLAYFAPEAGVCRVLNGGHPYGKEQWREVHAWVAHRAVPGDLVLVHAPFLHMTWDFYDQDQPLPAAPIPPLDLPCDRLLSPDEIRRAFPTLTTAKSVFVVLSHEATDRRDDYRDAVGEAVSAAWGGLSGIQAEEFPRQWGIRVVRFVRP
jgi:mannosyltransferase